MSLEGQFSILKTLISPYFYVSPTADLSGPAETLETPQHLYKDCGAVLMIFALASFPKSLNPKKLDPELAHWTMEPT